MVELLTNQTLRERVRRYVDVYRLYIRPQPLFRELYEEYGPMFDGASSFNQPLTTWDTSRVKDFSCMFQDAQQFNQPIQHFFDQVGKKECRYGNILTGAIQFRQPLISFIVVGNNPCIQNIPNQECVSPLQ